MSLPGHAIIGCGQKEHCKELDERDSLVWLK